MSNQSQEYTSLSSLSRTDRTDSFSCQNNTTTTKTLNNNQGSEEPKKSSWLCGLSVFLGPFKFLWSFSLRKRKQESDTSEPLKSNASAKFILREFIIKRGNTKQ